MASMKLVKFDYANAMAKIVGEKDGITDKELSSAARSCKKIHKEIQAMREKGKIGFFDLPYDNMLMAAINAIANDIRRNFENFVVVGIGGSSLGPRCLQNALSHYSHNHLDASKRRNRPRIFFMDNPDPDAVKGLLDTLDLRSTAFNVISKSGGTAETMAIFMHLYNVVQRRFSKSALSKHFIITTDPNEGLLREVAVQDKMKTLPIPENVGGRFSVFSSVGLLPAAVAGINIKALLEGAGEMDKRCSKNDLMKNPAYLNAVIHHLADARKGKSISVMMPYSSRLRTVADWYAQIWAESLGKAVNTKGETVNVGQTPVKALGAVDQHSQVQLYMEGPNDKIITFIEVEKFQASCTATKVFHTIEGLNHLADKDLGELLKKELLATEFALTKNHRPNVKIILDEVSPECIGALLYMLEIQTTYAGFLYDINAFDQPGVEEGKRATHALMGRKTKADREKMKEIKAYAKERKSYKCL